MQNNINKKIEDTMHSIDGINKANPDPFFFTRLEARMEKENNVWVKITSFVARPMVAFACICLVIMINALVILSSSISNKTVAKQNTEYATVDEYAQMSTTLYDFENTKP